MGKRNFSVAGIDTGSDGGIAIIRANGNIFTERMPVKTIERVDRKPLHITDGKELESILLENVDSGGIQIWYEENEGWRGDSGSRAFTHGGNYHIVLDRISELSNGGVLPVRPKEWQRAILKVRGVGRDEMKRLSVEFCKRRWPNASLSPGKLRSPHKGIADALCVATYGLYKFEGDSKNGGRKTKGHRA